MLEALVAETARDAEGRITIVCSASLAALALRELLYEALAALLDNAARHTRGDIRLEAREVGDAVEIDVVDAGEGIPPEQHARIFEPFYRVTDTGEGFGLGLAIAHQAVEAMGGELSSAQAPGTGTAFTIRLASEWGDEQSNSSHRGRAGDR